MSGNTLSENKIKQALSDFHTEMIRIKQHSHGFSFTSTVCMPDGWQIIFDITQLSESKYKLSDKGATLSWLMNKGQNISSDLIRGQLERICKDCNTIQEGLELVKWLDAPLCGEEIHIFSESLQLIANLYLLHEPRIKEDPLGIKIVEEIFQESAIKYRRDYAIEVSPSRHFKVDFYSKNKKATAIKILTTQTDFTGAVEKWHPRWKLLKDNHPELSPVMLYDRNKHQSLSSYTIQVAEDVCSLFCGFDEKDKIYNALQKL